MEQQTETRELIADLKHYLVRHAHLQRQAKRARRTLRTPAAERTALLLKLGLADNLATIQSFIAHQRHWLTVAHVLYGDCRGRPHPVRDPAGYRASAEFFVGQILRAQG